MSELEVTKALRAKRAEITGVLRDLEFRAKRLKQVLAGNVGTIRVFVPGSSPQKIPTAGPYKRGVVFKRNEVPCAFIEVLLEAPAPMTTGEIIAAIALAKDVEGKPVSKRVRSCVSGLSNRGIIAPQGDETPMRWALRP